MRISDWSSDVCSSDLLALKLMESERVSFLVGRPHQWARLQEMPNWANADLSSLRYVTNAELLQTHPTVNIDWRLPMTFGTTETMTAATTYTANTSVEQYAGSAGEPLPGNTLKIIDPQRSEEHTSELQSLMRNSYAVFCLKKKNKHNN